MHAEQLRTGSRERDLIREAQRMLQVPGVHYQDRGAGRTACLAGTGIPVWLVIKIFRNMDEDRFSLAQALHWLTHDQIQAAFDYYDLFSSEIEAELADDASFTPERVAEMNRAMQARIQASK